MVWYGMVWYGMAWYGMVWHGMVQCVVAQEWHCVGSVHIYMHMYTMYMAAIYMNKETTTIKPTQYNTIQRHTQNNTFSKEK